MDDFGDQAPLGAFLGDDDPAEWTLAGTVTVPVTTTSGGRVEQRQERMGARLRQTVEIRRRDGSVWTAYARQLALPADPGEAERATEQASCVLNLLAQAVAAADTARQARGAMLEWDAAPPPWAAHYA